MRKPIEMPARTFLRLWRKFVPTWPTAVAVLLTGAYTLTLFSLSTGQHDRFLSQRNDLTVMEAAIAEAAAGHLAMGDRLLFHHNLVFWVIAPFYKLAPGPGLLFFLASLAAALTGLGLYLIARRHVDRPAHALIPAVVFWLAPTVHYANLYDFHVICLATCLLIYCFWAFEGDKTVPGFVLLGLFLSCQEEMSFVALFLALALFLRGKRKTGLIIAAVAAAYLLLVTQLLVPRLVSDSSDAADQFVILRERYGWLGESPAEIVANGTTSLWGLLKKLVDLNGWRPVEYFAVAGGVLCRGAWSVLLMALPHLVMGLLSNSHWSSTVVGTYYWIMVQAILLLALVFAAKNAEAGFRRRLCLYYPALAGLLLSYLLSPLPFGRWSRLSDFEPAPASTHAAFAEVAAAIKDGAHVATQLNLIPHLPFPLQMMAGSLSDWKQADTVLLRLKYDAPINLCLNAKASPEHFYTISPDDFAKLARKLVASPDWTVLAYKENFLLLSRQASTTPAWLQRTIMQDIDAFERQFSAATSEFVSTVPEWLCRI